MIDAGGKSSRRLVVTVSDRFFFPGTVATVNSVLHFQPDADVVVVNNNLHQEGLTTAQKALFTGARVRVLDASYFEHPSRKLAAWELKAHAASDLTAGYDVLIGIDSDCILCAPIEDVIAQALCTQKFYGGSDGQTHYDVPYRAYGIRTPVTNPKYMSSSLYVCALSPRNRRIVELWSQHCNNAIFGGGERYPGHGDQGVLNAILYKHLGPQGVQLLNNPVWSQHGRYWSDSLIVVNGQLWHSSANGPQRSLHCGGTEKFWTARHLEMVHSNPRQRINYAWFLMFLWFGECAFRSAAGSSAAPCDILPSEFWHLAHAPGNFRGELALIGGTLGMSLPHVEEGIQKLADSFAGK